MFNRKSMISMMLCAAMGAHCIPTLAADGELLINETFNASVTNGYLPESIDAVGNRMIVKEYEPGEKGIYIAASAQLQSVKFAAQYGVQYFFSFDISADADFNASLSQNEGTIKRVLLKIENGTLMTHNGKIIDNVGSRMKSIAVGVNAAHNTYSVYIDGKCVISDNYINEYKLGECTAVSFEASAGAGAGIVLDNIYAAHGEYDSSKKPTQAPYNNERLDEVDFAPPGVTDKIYLFEPFDFGKTLSTATLYANGNEFEVRDDDGGALYFKRKPPSSNAYIDFNDASISGEPSSSVVYQADVKITGTTSEGDICLRDYDAHYLMFAFIRAGGKLAVGSKTYQLPMNKWCTLSFVYDISAQTYDAYVNGKKIASDVPNSDGYRYDRGFIYRFDTLYGGSDDGFMIDNMAIYGGTAPKTAEELSQGYITVRTDFDEICRIARSEKNERRFMQGKVGYHTASGVAYANGEKSIIGSIIADGTTMIDADFFGKCFGTPVQTDGVKVSIGGRDVTGKIPTPKMIDGKYYLALRSVCENALGKVVTYDNSCVNGGMIIISDEPVTLPANDREVTIVHDDAIAAYKIDCSDLQNLNDFLFFLRPTAEQVGEAYKKSELSGVHPRILADADDFAHMRSLADTDERMGKWYRQLLNEADIIVNSPSLEYDVSTSSSMWFQGNNFISRMEIIALAYRLSGDEKYAERAWQEMKAIADFPDWHPAAHLDVFAFSIGFSIGYDWIYDYLDDAQREYLEKAIYKFGYIEYFKGYDGLTSIMGDGFSAGNNHNAVGNGSATLMALAFMDVYPEASKFLISNAFRQTENSIFHFAPEGAWFEGVAYGVMTLHFLAYHMASLDKVFGTTFTLDKSSGLSDAAEYVLYMQSPAGPYTFSDSSSNGVTRDVVYDPGVLWFSEHYKTYGVVANWYKVFDTGLYGDTLARSILWYNPEAAAVEGGLDIDKIYTATNVETMRNTWNPMGQVMVGIKGGKANVEHGHCDMGSFEYLSGKTRWLDDVGADDYNLFEFFYGFTRDGRRWSYFRERAEAHNCLVIDPDRYAEYDVNETAILTPVLNKPRGAICTIDMTRLFGTDKVSAAQRGFLFTDDRQSLVVRDEVTLKKESDVYWFGYTNEKAEVDGDTVILESVKEPGEKLRIDFVSNQPFELYLTDMAPLPETAPYVTGSANTGKRIVLKSRASGELNITAKLTPMSGENTTDISEHNMPISDWRVPDGEITVKPYLDKLTADDTELSISATSQSVLVGEDDPIPTVTAQSAKYDVKIKQSTGIGDAAAVTVTDRGNADNVSVYSIVFKHLDPTGYPGVKEFTIKSVTASAEPETQNGAGNVLDRNRATRWSSDNEQYLTLDLGKKVTFNSVIMAFMDGSNRKYNLAVSVSNDGETFTEVYRGKSSGTTDDYELFPLGRQTARYVRITGNGHADGTWNSWTEVAVALSE